MTTAGPWSVKGIDPKAREIAKDLARRSGLTLGEWLNQMITEEAEAPAPVTEPPRPAREPGGLTAEALRTRLREAGKGGGEAGEGARIGKALADLTVRVEAAEHRSAQAISGIEQQTQDVLARLHGVEQGRDAAAARVEGALDEVRDLQGRVAERLRQSDAAGGPRAETMRALEGALGKVAAQLYEGESRARAQGAELRDEIGALSRRLERAELSGGAGAGDPGAFEAAVTRLAERMDEAQRRTGVAVRALETSFAGLDQRLARAETGRGGEARLGEGRPDEGRFERLAAELSERVEGARTEMATRLKEAADGKLDRMEAALRELSGQVADSEKRSAGAIDRMGREVVRIAQGLDGRVAEVERRSHKTAEVMGGEMSRIADVVESRLARADTQQAQALEKLGGEIARIAEKLADRIAAAERRGAQDLTRGLDEVGEQVARVTDKLNTRYDHAAADLAERVRASEDRTRQLLEEAQARIDARASAALAAAPFADSEEAPSHAASIFDSHFDAEPEDAPFPQAHAFSPPAPSPGDRFDSVFDDGPFGHAAFTAEDEVEPVRAPGGGFEADDVFAQPAPAPAAEAEPAQPLSSTRRLIEEARAAARANSDTRGRRPSRSPRAPELTAGEAAAEEPSIPAPGFGGEEPQRRGFGLPRLRRRESSTVKTALYASGVAVFTSMAMLGGVWMLNESGAHAGPTTGEAPSAAPPVTAAPAGAAMAQAASPALLAVAQTAPELAAAAPVPTPEAAAPALKADATAASIAATASARALYNTATKGLETGEPGAVETLKHAANLGYAPAQFHLGKLYEDGASGLKKDVAEAHRWTERAARGGDAKAMFNLGLYLANGEGAARDDKGAVDWFRRAADGGVKDAQFNLAVMNQNGRGVPASLAEAYKWFLIAAADGDAAARSSAEALKPSLGLDAQAAAERSAAAYRAQTAAAQVRTAAR